MQSPSSEGAAPEASWQWDGEEGGDGEAPQDVIGGGGDGPRLTRRRLLIGGGLLAAGGAAWAFGRSGADAPLPSPGPPRPQPTPLSGPTPAWTYRGPEAMTPERLTDPPSRPVYLSKNGLQVLDPARGTAARLLVFDPPETRNWPNDLDMLGKVVIGPDRLFTTTYEGHLEARHFTDPAADWSLPLPEGLQDTTRLTGYDRGVLYGYSWGRPRPEDKPPFNRLFALRVADRALLWSVGTDHEEQPVTPATSTDGNHLACVRFLGNRALLVVRDAADGRELWTAPGDEDLRWCTAGTTNVYVPDGNGGVRALRPDGQSGWTFSPAAGESWRALPPVPDGGRVYLLRDNGIVTGHDAATGAVQWTCRLPYLLDRRSHPAVSGPTLFVPGTAIGGVSAIDTATGTLSWTFRDSGPGRDVWSLAADADRLYAGHDDILHALPLH
ncbi:PQQ-binding-like beta-propeller repeat protein [Kitasatospora sp. NPDC056446]|uniref:outer membrane protein assembly factor BamB family protein n=1 Tax=Kitasatospora sp. NPDC056446 TaxID=3345819 RepID=UPI0036A66FF7